jgi:hypothetical protein
MSNSTPLEKALVSGRHRFPIVSLQGRVCANNDLHVPYLDLSEEPSENLEVVQLSEGDSAAILFPSLFENDTYSPLYGSGKSPNSRVGDGHFQFLRSRMSYAQFDRWYLSSTMPPAERHFIELSFLASNQLWDFHFSHGLAAPSSFVTLNFSGHEVHYDAANYQNRSFHVFVESRSRFISVKFSVDQRPNGGTVHLKSISAHETIFTPLPPLPLPIA